MKDVGQSPQRPEEVAPALAAFDELLAVLGQERSPENDLVREHLEGARFYLNESSPVELAVNLKLAEESLDGLPDGDLKRRIQTFLDDLRSRKISNA
jgi:hypothetical protein